MSYTPHTEQDIRDMLEAIGANDVMDLFDEIPADLKSFDLSLPSRQSEQTASQASQALAETDGVVSNFLGAGAYEHYIPAAVWDLVSRGEFMTAYTPYQAEASQGTLQVIFEFQTMMTELTGLPVSNASMYDGATALAEAALMAVRAHKSKNARDILVPDNLHPHYKEVLRNLTQAQNIRIIPIDFNQTNGSIELSSLRDNKSDTMAAVIVAQPNFFGTFEQVDEITDWAHQQGALVISVVNPTSLAVLKAPGEWGKSGADIAVGEGQPLGVPLSGGGPYFGFMCCTKPLVRQLPGRIVGQTTDQDGKRGYTLTLQAREQHIRRSKATSNICTNQGLAVTAATIYMSILGFEGLLRVASKSMSNCRKLMTQLEPLGIKLAYGQHYFHEFVVKLPCDAEAFVNAMIRQQIDPGLPVSRYFSEKPNQLLICLTETKTQTQIDAYVQAAKQALAEIKTGGPA